jgi:hypothetical protein
MAAAAVIIMMAHKMPDVPTHSVPLTDEEKIFMTILAVLGFLIIVGIYLWEDWRYNGD